MMNSLVHERNRDAAIADVAKSGPRVAYWATTSVLVLCMTGGVFELLRLPATIGGITRLGYPAYIIPVFGLGKVLAVLAILAPGLQRLKEWAYAGICCNMVGAAVSHVAHDDGVWIVAVTVAIIAMTIASWALRPADRRL